MTGARFVGGVGMLVIAGLVVGAAFRLPARPAGSISSLAILGAVILVAVGLTAIAEPRSTPYW